MSTRLKPAPKRFSAFVETSEMASVICSRCRGSGHAAAACRKPFFKSCDYCPLT